MMESQDLLGKMWTSWAGTFDESSGNHASIYALSYRNGCKDLVKIQQKWSSCYNLSSLRHFIIAKRISGKIKCAQRADNEANGSLMQSAALSARDSAPQILDSFARINFTDKKGGQERLGFLEKTADLRLLECRSATTRTAKISNGASDNTGSRLKLKCTTVAHCYETVSCLYNA